MKTLTDKIRDLLDAGHTREDIMEKLGVKRQTLVNHWPIDRPLHGNPHFKRRLKEIERHGKEVARMHCDGLSFAAISQQIGLKTERIMFIWRNGPKKGQFTPSSKMRAAVAKAVKKVGQNAHLVAKETGFSRELVRQVLHDG